MILVTGGTGLIGSHVVKLLNSQKSKLLVANRTRSANITGSTTILLDLLDKQALERLHTYDISAIVHCAAILPEQFYGGQAEEAANKNLQMDDFIIKLCKAKKCRLVYISSTSVYGSDAVRPITENIGPEPQGPYAQAKLISERRFIEEIESQVTILRINAPYGIGQRNRTVMQVFIENALKNRDLQYYGSGERQQDFVWAGDVAEAVSRVLSRNEANGVFNLSGDAPITMRGLANLILSLVPGSTSKVIASGKPDPQETYRVEFDLNKAKTILGWYPKTSLKNGIASLIAHLRGIDEDRHNI